MKMDDIGKLFKACEDGDLNYVKNALEDGADPDTKDKNGYTLLITATINGKLDIVKLLIGYDADLDITDNDGKTAVSWSASQELHDITKVLIDAGADVNKSDIDGQVPLLNALLLGNTEIASMLLDAGAKYDITNKVGWSVLDYALKRTEDDTIFNKLIKLGADISLGKSDKFINKKEWWLRYDIQELIFNEQQYNIKVLEDNVGIRDDIKKKYIDLYNAAVVLNVWSIN